MRRPFRELPDNSAGIFKCEPGVAQRHERHGDSDKENPREGPTLERGQPQRYWKKQRDNSATSESEALLSQALLSDKQKNLEKPRMEPTRQPEAGTVPLQGVAEWRQTVALAAIDAEFNEGVFRGHSMEKHGAVTRVDETPPRIHITSKPPSSESSNASPSKQESMPQSEPKDKFKDTKTSNHGDDNGDDGNNDDDNVDDSFESEPSSSSPSSFSDFELADNSMILELIRQAGYWRPAILDLPKRRMLRCMPDWEDKRLKSEIMRYLQKGERHYKKSERHHNKAERNFKIVEALLTKHDDNVS
ncbi:MAG: hypothetical protein Q9199_001110 [Rusavskia elegans]